MLTLVRVVNVSCRHFTFGINVYCVEITNFNQLNVYKANTLFLYQAKANGVIHLLKLR